MSKIDLMLSEWIVWSPIRDLFLKTLRRYYKYHLHFRVAEFEIIEE